MFLLVLPLFGVENSGFGDSLRVMGLATRGWSIVGVLVVRVGGERSLFVICFETKNVGETTAVFEGKLVFIFRVFRFVTSLSTIFNRVHDTLATNIKARPCRRLLVLVVGGGRRRRRSRNW